MKQPMNYTKDRAHRIRQVRGTASKLKSLSQVYKRVDQWSESGVADSLIITVKLLSPWSFSETVCQPVKTFRSVEEAMRGVHKTYLETEAMIFASKKVSVVIAPKTNLERLQDLVEASAKR